MRGKRAKALRRLAREFSSSSGYVVQQHRRCDPMSVFDIADETCQPVIKQTVVAVGQRRYYQWLKRTLVGVPILQLRRREV